MTMVQRIDCPGCDSILKVDDRHAGKTIACPKCANKVRVPEVSANDSTVPRSGKSRTPEATPPRERSRATDSSQKPIPRRPPAKPAQAEDIWDQPLDDFDDEDDDFTEVPRGRSAPARRATKPSRQSSGSPAWLHYAAGFGACAVLFAFVWLVFLRPGPIPLEVARQEPTESPADRQARERREGIAEPAASKEISSAASAPIAAPSPETAAKAAAATSVVAKGGAVGANAEKAALAAGSVTAETAGAVDLAKLRPSSAPTKNWRLKQMDVTPDKSDPNVPEGAELPLEEMIEQVGDCVVVIRVKDKAGQDVGLGSGFVIDSSGLIATCHHVVRGAHKVVVRFRNGTESDVTGFRQMNADGDLAILEMAKKFPKLRALPLALDKPLRPGQEVIAIGHPSGLSFTPTRGIVSGVHKTSELPTGARQFLKKAPKDQQWIQTDAVISPGNSGGPLFNRKGEVIGVNSWLSPQTRFAFAVHVQHLRDLQNQLYADVKPISGAGSDSASSDLDPEVQAVVTDFRRAAEEFMVDYGKARQKAVEERDSSDLKKLLKTNPAKPFAGRLLQIATTKKKTPSAFQALSNVCEVLAFSDPDTTDDLMQRATRQLLEDHVAEEELEGVVLNLQKLEHLSIRSFLQSLMQKSPHRNVKAFAGLSLVVHLENRLEEIENEVSAQKLDKEILTICKRVASEFGDVEYDDTTLAKILEPVIFEKENLSVGCKVPEIAGVDLDGAEFKSSEYSGKAVLLVFWGDWCPVCRQYYPYLRKIVKNFDGKPFVMLGVNSDEP
ncbi:MAG: trypsin-like peptidase domain-containing protein, partial [Planctomycetaceae bacterium]